MAKAAVAFHVAADDSPSSPSRLPKKVRRRLLESSSPEKAPAKSREEIEAKLKEADNRRKQFHEWLSSKARPKSRSPRWSDQDEDLGQRLEAKLNAAEQKRQSMLAEAQMRLGKLHELRQAAKISVQMRYERAREELGSKVEFRVQQAEENRKLLMKANRQKRAEAKERIARALLERMVHEDRYKEQVHKAICQKRAAAEKKRLDLIEAEKTRARATYMQACRVAKIVCNKREVERKKMEAKLEYRLQRARKQRAEYLRHRGSSQGSTRSNWLDVYRSGEVLSRKLARLWKKFLRSRRTTFALAKSYEALGINSESVKIMPFEQLAAKIESTSTLQAVKSLLVRFESRFVLSHANNSKAVDIDHLLKHLSSPKKKTTSSGGTTRSRGLKRGSSKGAVTEKGSSEGSPTNMRYLVRVVLCAYMILGHPEAVFSCRGEREVALAESAAKFVKELETLVNIVINAPASPRASTSNNSPDSYNSQQPSSFRSGLAAFDEAWCSYLYTFVVWKVKDARVLEEDLIKAACQLELSMMQKCRMSSDGEMNNLSDDLKAIQKQVIEDRKLLCDRVQNLSGISGVKRMEKALSDVRSDFFKAKENGNPLVPQFIQVLPTIPDSSTVSFPTFDQEITDGVESKLRPVARALFGPAPASSAGSKPYEENFDSNSGQSQERLSIKSSTENELLVNEIIHERGQAFSGKIKSVDKDQAGLLGIVRDTMEKAFWDEVTSSIGKGKLNYARIIELVKEVRDELCVIAPENWKEEIFKSIDLDTLSHVIQSQSNDVMYMSGILDYALITVQKLASPAMEDSMKITHKKLLDEVAEVVHGQGAFDLAIVKGLRFVLEQIQMLKREISLARLHLVEPIISGAAGYEYLKRAFEGRHGIPSNSSSSLPLTMQWLASIKSASEQEWNDHCAFLTSFNMNQTGLPPTVPLRTGGAVTLSTTLNRPEVASSSIGSASDDFECTGDKVDLLIRLGLLKLVCAIKGIDDAFLPETLKLNYRRLHMVQSKLQKVIVICSSLLVLRQTLLAEEIAPTSAFMETATSDSYKRLSHLLENPTSGILEIVESLEITCLEFVDRGSGRSLVRKELMAGMLNRSLQAGDAIFLKVTNAVHLAFKELVLCGNGTKGKAAAEAVLRRIGAAIVTDQLADIAAVLTMVAVVSNRVHSPWYERLIN